MSAARTTLLAVLLITLGFASRADSTTPLEAPDPWSTSLRTLNGEVDLLTLRDKPLVLSFFFTSCAVACPAQTAKLARVQRDLPVRVKEGSHFVSLSIDPGRDTHRRIADYATSFGADLDHWTFGTVRGRDALQDLLGFLDLEVKPGRYGQLDHAMVVYLIRPDGEVVQRYVGHTFQASQLLQDLIHVVHPVASRADRIQTPSTPSKRSQP